MAEPKSGAHFDEPGLKDATQHVVGHLDPTSKRNYSATSKANHAAYGMAAQVNAELRKAVGLTAKDGDYGIEFYKSIARNYDLSMAYFDCLHRLLKQSRDWENRVSWWLNENDIVRQQFEIYLKMRRSKKGRAPGSKTSWDGSTSGFITRNTKDEQRNAEDTVEYDFGRGDPGAALSRISALSHVKFRYAAAAWADSLPLNRNDRERVFKAIGTVLLDGGTSAATKAELVKFITKGNIPRTKLRKYITTSSELSEKEKHHLLTLLFP